MFTIRGSELGHLYMYEHSGDEIAERDGDRGSHRFHQNLEVSATIESKRRGRVVYGVYVVR